MKIMQIFNSDIILEYQNAFLNIMIPDYFKGNNVTVSYILGIYDDIIIWSWNLF